MITTELTDIKSKVIAWFESLPVDLANAEQRKTALSNFLEGGFPTIKNEDWKYTSVNKIVNIPYELTTTSTGSFTQKELSQFPFTNLDVYYQVFINGHYNARLSNFPSTENGLTISHLSDPAAKELANKYFNTVAKNDSGFASLNTALTTDGTLIHLSPGKNLDKPLFLVFIADSRIETPLIQPRNIIVAEKNNELQLVELFLSIGENQSLTNSITEVLCGENAHIDYTKIHLEGDNNYHVATTQFELLRDASVSSHTLSIDGGFIRNNLNFVLKDKNCNVLLNGIYLPNRQQFMDNHTLVDHASPECYSNELYKGIVNDSGTAVFNGKIMVRRDAQKTNAYQRNMNMLLSTEGSVNTKPQLEIFADDVRCTHGATTGQIDEEAVFYLRSRGLSAENAKTLLMNAFADEIIEHLKVEDIKKS